MMKAQKKDFEQELTYKIVLKQRTTKKPTFGITLTCEHVAATKPFDDTLSQLKWWNKSGICNPS